MLDKHQNEHLKKVLHSDESDQMLDKHQNEHMKTVLAYDPNISMSIPSAESSRASIEEISHSLRHLLSDGPTQSPTITLLYDDELKHWKKFNNIDQELCFTGEEQPSEQHQLKTIFIVDSGCTSHVTPHRSDLSSYRRRGGSIMLGNTNQVQIEAEGDVRLSLELNLSHTLLAPRMRLRLFSISQFLEGPKSLRK
jgi:hypothetical protein